MKLTLVEKLKLTKLSGRASDLLVNMIDEALPKAKIPTKTDTEFKEVLARIYKLCPLLSDSYTQTYNYIQEEKISRQHSYVKRLRKD